MTDNRPHEDRQFDIDTLLHPANAYAHPLDVVHDCDLTLNEKRAILASWASDACAVEAAPELRAHPGGNPVRWDDIMDALRTLDNQAERTTPVNHKLQLPWRRGLRRRSDDGHGPLHL